MHQNSMTRVSHSNDPNLRRSAQLSDGFESNSYLTQGLRDFQNGSGGLGELGTNDQLFNSNNWSDAYPYSSHLDIDPSDNSSLLGPPGHAFRQQSDYSSDEFQQSHNIVGHEPHSPWNQCQVHKPSISSENMSQSLYTGGQGYAHVGDAAMAGYDTGWQARSNYDITSQSSSFSGSPADGLRPNIGYQARSTAGYEDEAGVEDDEWALQSMEGVDDNFLSPSFANESGPRWIPERTHFSSGTASFDQQEQAFARSVPLFPTSSHNAVFASARMSSTRDLNLVTDHRAPDINVSEMDVLPDAPIHPGSVAIPTPNLNFPEDLSSSWPPSREVLPPYYDSTAPAHVGSGLPVSKTTVTRPRGNTDGATRMMKSASQQSALAVRTVKKRSSVKKSRSNSLSESKDPRSPTRAPARKGGRVGKLPETQAPIVAQKRQEKSVCIWCRLRRVTCPRPSKEVPCTWCHDRGENCIQATFTEISDYDTSNCIFQSFSVYPTLDQSQRYYLRYPSTFDVPRLIETLDEYQSNFEVRVQSFTGAVWKMNLEFCYRLLCQVASNPRSRPYQLQEMVVGKRGLLNGWVDCIRPMESNLSKFERFHKYTNMPSRNIYSLAPLDDSKPDQPLNIKDPRHQRLIRMIIQLCRIVLRALEISALRELQQKLNDMSRGRRTVEEIETLAYEVAQLLGSLRWRLAWWQKIEAPFNSIEFTRRTTALAEILYFWFFAARKRLPESSPDAFPRGMNATYADIGEIWDEFPAAESNEGFRVWLFKAHQIIHDSRLSGDLPTFNDQSIVATH